MTFKIRFFSGHVLTASEDVVAPVEVEHLNEAFNVANDMLRELRRLRPDERLGYRVEDEHGHVRMFQPAGFKPK